MATIYRKGANGLELLNKGASSVVIDSLTSENTHNALSANQGRVLKGMIDATDEAVDEINTNLTQTNARLGNLNFKKIDLGNQTFVTGNTTNNYIDITSFVSGAGIDPYDVVGGIAFVDNQAHCIIANVGIFNTRIFLSYLNRSTGDITTSAHVIIIYA